MGPPLAFTFDPRTLREVVDDPAALAGWLAAALQERAPADPFRHHTEVGLAARLLGRLPLAEEHLAAAAALAPTPSAAVLARVRLAHVWHWQGRLVEAEASLRSCLAAAEPRHAHSVHQHLGKCLLDAGDLVAALEQFQRALDLRIAAGADEELIASTLMAVELTAQRLGSGGPG